MCLFLVELKAAIKNVILGTNSLIVYEKEIVQLMEGEIIVCIGIEQ